jgi:hypothetical protein
VHWFDGPKCTSGSASHAHASSASLISCAGRREPGESLARRDACESGPKGESTAGAAVDSSQQVVQHATDRGAKGKAPAGLPQQ